MPHTVVLVGSLDTKGAENDFVKQRIEAAGVRVIVLDTSVLGEPGLVPDVTREEVAVAGGRQHADLVAEHDRGRALTVMAAGAAAIVRDLQASGLATA